MAKDNKITGRSTTVIMKPALDVRLPPDARSIGLDFESSWGVKIKKYVAAFVPRQGLFGDNGDLRVLIHEPITVGIIVNCMNNIWFVESEPTTGNSFGLLVYAPQTASGSRGRKPVMSGEGRISIKENRSRSVRFSFQTVYNYVSSSPRRDSVSGGGSISRSKQSFHVKYSIEF